MPQPFDPMTLSQQSCSKPQKLKDQKPDFFVRNCRLTHLSLLALLCLSRAYGSSPVVATLFAAARTGAQRGSHYRSSALALVPHKKRRRSIMVRRIVIALAAATAVCMGAMATPTTADARMVGMHAGSFHAGFVGPRHFGPHFSHFHRFHRHRFGFAAVPFFVGAGVYASSCWDWRWTPWGWRRVWICGPGDY